ncbi:DUF3347 domain-containing protein [Microscilla marina]|uniref:MerP, putative n=1 Tax=Microscilla marina ATCC 23134 TaxID=313606 RepID=A1ZIH2_MICM2|nr:DUF3347 domain-containing protein [Microscilla marina]EAY29840.1 MerP, putative [Microscilla marina ATCC 23134]
MRKINVKIWYAALVMALTMGLQSCGSGEKKQADATSKDGRSTASIDGEKKNSKNSALGDAISEEAMLHVASLLDNYLALKNALVAGDAEKAKSSAQTTLTSLEKFDISSLTGKLKKVYGSQLDMIKTHNTKISKATDVVAQREELDMLSMHMLVLVKTFKANQIPLYKQHCPMAFDSKGAGWLSEKRKIRNPYFGEKMLKCGSIKDSIMAN